MSNYVTFGEFNNVDQSVISAPPPSYDNSSHLGFDDNYGHNEQQRPAPVRPSKYPIRQNITQPRNPYVRAPYPYPPSHQQQQQRKFYDNPYYYDTNHPQASPTFFSNSALPPLPPPSNTMESFALPPTSSFSSSAPTTTPIGMAFSESYDDDEKPTTSSLHFSNRRKSEMSPSPSSFVEGTDDMGVRFRGKNPLHDSTCVDINDHVVNCPICSTYYQNYTTMYVGIIILLGFIILIFLLKTIMEIKR